MKISFFKAFVSRDQLRKWRSYCRNIGQRGYLSNNWRAGDIMYSNKIEKYHTKENKSLNPHFSDILNFL